MPLVRVVGRRDARLRAASRGTRGNAILMDGHFTDWQRAGAPLFTRSESIQGSAVELDTLWAANDAA